MHGSIWTWRGDPDDLARRYEDMVATIPPASMRFSGCTRIADGIVVFDTCPTKQDFDQFHASEGLRALLAAHGLGEPESIADWPVVVAFAEGRRVDRNVEA